MSNEGLIYDFEAIVEPAVEAVLNSVGIATRSAQSDPENQKPRPRLEVKYVHGSGMSRWVVIVDGQNVQQTPSAADGISPKSLWQFRRESAWACAIKFTLVTPADPKIHADYRSKFRAQQSNLWVQLNGLALTRHTLNLISDGGSGPQLVSDDKAYYRTDFTFNGTISVNADAWAVLIPDNPPQYRYYTQYGAQWRKDILSDIDQVFGYLGDQLWHTVLWDSTTGRFQIAEQGQS